MAALAGVPKRGVSARYPSGVLRHEWRPLGPKATEVTVPCVPSVDLVAIDLPDAPVGWVRLKVSVVSADPQVVGVSLLAASGQRFRLRKSGQGFDQILLRPAEAGHLEVSGLALSEVHVSLAPSSPWAARWRVAQAVTADIRRLGIRRRNLRTLGIMLRARDFSSIGQRLTARYHRAPQAASTSSSVLTPEGWMRRFMTLTEAEQLALEATPVAGPSFSFIVTGEGDPSVVITSLQNQLGVDPEVLVVDDPNKGLAAANGDWVVLTNPAQRFHPASVFALSQAAQNPEVHLLVADGCYETDGQATSIWANPPWNLDLILEGEGAGPLVAVRRAVALEVGPVVSDVWATPTDLALKVVAAHGEASVAQVPFPLVTSVGSQAHELDQVVAQHLEQACPQAKVLPGLTSGTRHVQWPLPQPAPLVSVLIPTKDRAALLERCLTGLYQHTEYPNIEIILVDHQSTEAAAQKILAQSAERPNTQVLQFSGPFNFAAMNNLAAQAAKGEVLCLLNNDTEVTHPGWLTELVAQVSRPEVGAVGPMLRYPDGTVQHAGLHPNLGSLYGHGHKHFPPENFGYRNRLATAHRVAAVTGACLVTPKSLWTELGGMDEAFAVAYNDVDYCLQVRQVGHQVMWTPYAELIHHESVSRGYDEHPKEGDRLAREAGLLQQRWADSFADDPAYSPNLTWEDTNFSLSDNPRTTPPWRTVR